MNSSDIFSITDLRKQPSTILERSETRPQFIFKNNKMVGVLVSPQQYDSYTDEDIGVLHEMKYEDLSQQQRERLTEVRNMDESEFTTYTAKSYEN